MLQSKLFTKIKREDPKDDVSKNAKLLIRAGYIAKEMAGVYTMLPLGLRVQNKIIDIIREEMNAIEGQEVLMTGLQDLEIWKKTGRWDDSKIDIWFKTKLKHGGEIGLSNTHEEPLTRIMTQHISSYKDLPQYVYQFQIKYRNEPRAKSGLLRGREFLMKDLYSFHSNKSDLDKYYKKVREAYHSIFNKLGIGNITYYCYADGGSFSKFSHEFQAVCPAGEDTIYLDRKNGIAINSELIDQLSSPLAGLLNELGLDIKPKDLEKVKSVEVGNIFPLGIKYSKPLGLNFTDKDGERKPVEMASYGIGVTRLMALIAEIKSDTDGLIWQKSIAPFEYHILCEQGNKESVKHSKNLYDKLLSKGIEVLLDNREETLPVKIKDADLIGCPIRIIVSARSLKKGGVEVKSRNSKEIRITPINEL